MLPASCSGPFILKYGDLERFKQLIERRGEESGAWRGEVQDGDEQ